MTTTNEPKYKLEIHDAGVPVEPTFAAARIVNRQSGVPIPDDEPLFILRARDNHAVKALEAYHAKVRDPVHRQAVALRIANFRQFALANPGRMHEPDTQLTDDWNAR